METFNRTIHLTMGHRRQLRIISPDNQTEQ